MQHQQVQQQHDDGVPGSRCFVVCGRSCTSEELQSAFMPYGDVQSVKVVREKGVAYVKYDKASAAALAIESLNGAVLNNGRGPKLKVLLAEAPTSRGMAQQQKQTPELELSSDPDNVPPRSRLFIVVPKLCEASHIQDDMSQFADLEYCKTDLAASRGVVFCKFTKSSSALQALEAIADRGMKVAGYTVKAMLAEPKTKRGRPEATPQDLMYSMQQSRLDYALNSMDPLKLQMSAGLSGNHMGMGLHDFAAIGGLSGLGAGISSFSALASNMNNMGNMGSMGSMNNMNGMNNMGNMNNMGMNNLPSDMHLGAQGLALMSNLGAHSHNSVSPVSPNNLAGVPLSKQRLFVVVHKGVTEDAIARLFRRFPGMEYCDLKKERATGKSKGYCYVNYSTPDAAVSAVEQLNGMEFPPHSGHRIKVMFAEPMGVRSSSNGAGPTPSIMPSSVHSSATSLPSRSPGMLSLHGGSMQASTPSAAHTPLSRSTGMGTVSGGGMGPITPDTVASVSDSLAGMSLHHIAAALPPNQVVDDSLERAAAAAAHLTSPVAPTVARELMFNVN